MDKRVIRHMKRQEVFWSVVAISTCHPSGWVREEAVKASQRLQGEAAEKVLPFLVLRCNDWVPSIAYEAQRLVHRIAQAASDESLALAFQAAVRLRESTRYAGGWLWHELERIMRSRPSAVQRLRLVRDERLQRWLFESEFQGPDSNKLGAVERGLASPCSAVRETAARIAAAEFDDSSVGPILPVLAKQPSARIRRIAVDLAERIGEEAVSVLEVLACDSRWPIRAASRFVLAKRGIACDREWYLARLYEPGAIAGLAEVGSARDGQTIAKALSMDAERRRQAIWALAKLEVPSLAELAIPMLADTSAAAAREALKALEAGHCVLPLPAVQQLAGHYPERALAASRLLGRWDAVGILLSVGMRATVRHRVQQELRVWVQRINSDLSTPNAEAVASAREALGLADWLDPKLHEGLRHELEFAARRAASR